MDYEAFTIRKGRYNRWAVIIPLLNEPAAILKGGFDGGRWGGKQQAKAEANRLNRSRTKSASWLSS